MYVTCFMLALTTHLNHEDHDNWSPRLLQEEELGLSSGEPDSTYHITSMSCGIVDKLYDLQFPYLWSNRINTLQEFSSSQTSSSFNFLVDTNIGFPRNGWLDTLGI